MCHPSSSRRRWVGTALADPLSEAEAEPLGMWKDEVVSLVDGVGLAGVLVTPEEVLLG